MSEVNGAPAAGPARTRELPRPESRPLPDAWSVQSGQYVHASGFLSLEAELLESDDEGLEEAESTARAVVSLIEWRRREFALAAWRPATDPGSPEAA